MGKVYVYGRYDSDIAIVRSHAMGRGIPSYDYFEDLPGETVQLEELLTTVSAGDTILVGTITDFMLPEIEDMMMILEDLSEAGVKVDSRLEPDYTIQSYRSAIRLAATICRVRMGKKPI